MKSVFRPPALNGDHLKFAVSQIFINVLLRSHLPTNFYSFLGAPFMKGDVHVFECILIYFTISKEKSPVTHLDSMTSSLFGVKV